MANANSIILESNERLATSIHSLRLMIKGLYEVEGSELLHDDVEALRGALQDVSECHTQLISFVKEELGIENV